MTIKIYNKIKIIIKRLLISKTSKFEVLMVISLLMGRLGDENYERY